MRDHRLHLALLAGTAGTAASLWLTDIPLGIPGEWTWQRIDLPQEQLDDALFGWLAAAITAFVYLVVCWLGLKRQAVCSRSEATLWLGGLMAAASCWLWTAQEGPAAPYGMTRIPWVLYYRGPSGYFHTARYEMPDTRTFVADYEKRMSEGDVLHIGTHPPGLFLLHRGFINLCHEFPALTRLLLDTVPDSVDAGFATISDQTRLSGISFGDKDRAAIWLAALVTQLAVIATILPLYLLLRQSFSRAASWMAVSFWPLLPALAIFLPKSDALYPLLSTTFLCCWMAGIRRRSALLCLIAGLVFWLGMLLSLALLPTALLAGFLCLWETRLRNDAQANQRWLARLSLSVGWAAAAVGIAVLLVWLALETNLLNVWVWNYRNHAAFYDHHPRTYWKWFLVNPIEGCFAVGWPVAILVAASFGKTVREAVPWSAPKLGPFYGCLIVWGLLWLSGKNMGEAARLWIVNMPWLIWLCGNYFSPVTAAKDVVLDSANLSRVWLLILVLQVVACAATITRVSGFHFPF